MQKKAETPHKTISGQNDHLLFLPRFEVLQKLKFSGDNFIAWLMRIVRNIAFDHLRRRQLVRGHHTSLEARAGDDRSLLDRLRDPTPNPLTLVESDDLLQMILQHIMTLPEKFRDVFLLRVTSDLTFDHIAKLQGAPISTVMTRMDTAVQKLRTALAAEGKIT